LKGNAQYSGPPSILNDEEVILF